MSKKVEMTPEQRDKFVRCCNVMAKMIAIHNEKMKKESNGKAV